MQTLSVLCSHQQETAVFLLRIPTFVSHVLAASKQWQLYGTAAEVDNRAILSPGDSMGLITPLLLAAATLTGSPLESNFKDLFEGLQSSLQITGIRLSTAMNRTSAHSIINVVGQEGVSNSIEAKEVEGSVAALLEEKKASLNSRHVATIPLGLIGSLRLIANEDGFARTLRAVTLSRQVGPAQMVVSALKKWSAGALQSCTANRTMSRRQLGSDRKVLRPQPSSTGEDEIGRNANESIELDVKQDMGSDSNMERQLDFELETHLEGDLEPDSTIQEQVEEEERCTNELEDVRRLVKSLQAAIEGLSTSKID